jgi:hypothetical protein
MKTIIIIIAASMLLSACMPLYRDSDGGWSHTPPSGDGGELLPYRPDSMDKHHEAAISGKDRDSINQRIDPPSPAGPD